MTTKRPTQRFGEPPVNPQSGKQNVPLPLVTQPMASVDGGAAAEDAARSFGEHTHSTRVDNPIQSLKPETAAVLFGKPTVQVAPMSVSQAQVILGRTTSPAGPPPQIELTQHHLPDEEPDARLVLVNEPDSERAAQFRVMRHHLLELGRPQCIVVSSPQPGDGKTLTAVNLALALAECGRAKVLLVETHLRRPQLANIFKLVPPWCFAEQLAAHRHQPMMPWSLIDVPALWLHVAAINPRNEKQQLLDGPAFAIAMERLRMGQYDHIVVDAPPVLGSADVNLMADAADTVVFALRARRSTTRDLRRAIDQIGAAKVSGTVLVQ